MCGSETISMGLRKVYIGEDPGDSPEYTLVQSVENMAVMRY